MQQSNLDRVHALHIIHVAVESRDQKGKLQRLLLVQARVTERRVPLAQPLLGQPARAADTLRDGLAGELEVHAAEEGLRGAVDLERLPQLGEDVAEVPCFHARGGGLRVAVHGVALPDGEVAGALDGGDVGGEVLADLAGAVAGNQGYLADFAVGVDDVEEADELVGGHAGADLDADGVGDAAEEFDVGTVELACAVADPEEVC